MYRLLLVLQRTDSGGGKGRHRQIGALRKVDAAWKWRLLSDWIYQEGRGFKIGTQITGGYEKRGVQIYFSIFGLSKLGKGHFLK